MERVTPKVKAGPRVWHDTTAGESQSGRASIELVDTVRPKPTELRSNETDHLVFCLNFAGRAQFRTEAASWNLSAGQAAIFSATRTPVKIKRLKGEHHLHIIVKVDRDYLRTQWGSDPSGCCAPVAQFLSESHQREPSMAIVPLPPETLGLPLALQRPPVSTAALQIWNRSKILEVLALLISEDDARATPLKPAERRTQERIELVRLLIERNLRNPPPLAQLAKKAGCSPFYLSRTFAAEMKMTIPHYVMLKRVEQATELLNEGRMTISDVAREVGYHSQHSFRQAFVKLLGRRPSDYTSGQ